MEDRSRARPSWLASIGDVVSGKQASGEPHGSQEMRFAVVTSILHHLVGSTLTFFMH